MTRLAGQPDTAPIVIGTPGSHDALRAALARLAPGRVLDVPAGEGPISQFLHENGWDVQAADIDAGNFRYRQVPFAEVNLNRPLPFDDASFDVVVCANGLHRLFNPGGAIREFHRVLRDRGRLYINVNNYTSIDRRLRMLLAGSMDTAVNEGQCRQTIDDPEAHVRLYLLPVQIANMLDAAGFDVTAVRPAAVLRRHRLLAPIAWACRLAAHALPAGRRRRDRLDIANAPGVCPGGQYVLFEAARR